MQVILIEHVAKLGKPGDIAKVADGYARNFLLPRKKALRATEHNIAIYEAKKAEIDAENAKKKAAAEALLPKLEGLHIELSSPAGDDGRLYGSVSKQEIASLISQKISQEFDHHFIALEQKIKMIGSYQVPLLLYPEVETVVSLIVARSESK